MLEPPYETSGSVIPVSGITRRIAADDDERLQREAEGQPGREQLREAVAREERDAEAAQHEDHVERSSAAAPIRPSSCASAE